MYIRRPAGKRAFIVSTFSIYKARVSTFIRPRKKVCSFRAFDVAYSPVCIGVRPLYCFMLPACTATVQGEFTLMSLVAFDFFLLGKLYDFLCNRMVMMVFQVPLIKHYLSYLNLISSFDFRFDSIFSFLFKWKLI